MRVSLHAVEMFVTLVLFAINIVVSVAVIGRESLVRLRHMGHELAFLAIGIVCAKIDSATVRLDAFSILAAVLLYVLIWLVLFAVSARILQDAAVWRHPLAYLAIGAGLVTVWTALADVITGVLRSALV